MAGISTKSVYGVIATYYIYKHQDKAAIKIQEISDKMDLPKNYLEQILLVLKKADILKSIRGAKGGYILAKDASTITVLSIMEALEGSFCDFEFGNRECSLIGFWEQAKQGVKDQFKIPISELDKFHNDSYKEFVYVI
ncbi:MAG: RrF2 family transcriptional regulator [Campylobacterota bacterium]